MEPQGRFSDSVFLVGRISIKELVNFMRARRLQQFQQFGTQDQHFPLAGDTESIQLALTYVGADTGLAELQVLRRLLDSQQVSGFGIHPGVISLSWLNVWRATFLFAHSITALTAVVNNGKTTRQILSGLGKILSLGGKGAPPAPILGSQTGERSHYGVSRLFQSVSKVRLLQICVFLLPRIGAGDSLSSEG